MGNPGPFRRSSHPCLACRLVSSRTGLERRSRHTKNARDRSRDSSWCRGLPQAPIPHHRHDSCTSRCSRVLYFSCNFQTRCRWRSIEPSSIRLVPHRCIRAWLRCIRTYRLHRYDTCNSRQRTHCSSGSSWFDERCTASCIPHRWCCRNVHRWSWFAWCNRDHRIVPKHIFGNARGLRLRWIIARIVPPRWRWNFHQGSRRRRRLGGQS